MIAYCDGSTTKGCYIIEGETAVLFPYKGRVTVNAGEYLALIALLKAVEKRAGEFQEGLTIYMDSELVVNQIVGWYQCRNYALSLLLARAWLALGKIQCKLFWIPREENKAGQVLEADKLLERKKIIIG